jgi:tail tube protein
MASPTVSRIRRLLVAMKVETTYATDVFGGTYTAADVIPAYNVTPDINLNEIPNTMASGDIGRLPSVIGQESGSVSFTMWLRGAGAAYAAGVKPEADRALRGCALIGTGSFTSGAEKWTYQPGTAESYTIYCVAENGRTLKLVGCFGTVQFAMSAGNQCIATFRFQGKIGGVSDVTYVGGVISGTPQYPVMKSSAWGIGAGPYQPRIASVNLDLGNTLFPIDAINDTVGLAGYFIGDRNPRMTIDPEIDTVANFDWYTQWRNGTLLAVTWQTGTVAYNRILYKINATGAAQGQIVNNGWGTRNGLVTAPATILATISAGSDDLSLVFS